MDRNSVIGFSLIAVIMIVWLQFMKPEQKAKLDTAQPAREMVHKDSTASAPPPVAPEASAETLGSFAKASTGTEKIITIDNDLFTAKLSSKGATLKSMVLKKHLDVNGKPFDLISDKAKGALSMLFLSNDGKRIDTRDLYFRSLDTKTSETVTGKQKLSVSFVLNVDASRSIEATYTFTGDSYVIDYDLSLKGFGSTLAGNEYQLDWDGGLVYSEKNTADESHNAISSAYLGGGLLKLDAKDSKKRYHTEESGKAEWVAVRNKYFVAALIPQRETEGVFLEGTKKNGSDFENYTAALKMMIPVGSQTVSDHYRLYVGPLDYNTVRSLHVGLEKIMDFGWDWLTRPFAAYLILPIFNWMNKYVTNYGLIIIIFAFLIKL
ncbi:MAG TPA: YidC/Oxa1 family membrane protein insertase, partial [Chlorobaculum parvum]|nr:YidC/Oxa1 family membrane protein insertase [Chlorobaculum parvum]